MVVVAVAVVIVTAAAPIDDAPLYSSWRRVARGGVAAVLCRAAGARRADVRTGETRVAIHLTYVLRVKCSESFGDTRQLVVVNLKFYQQVELADLGWHRCDRVFIQVQILQFHQISDGCGYGGDLVVRQVAGIYI